MIREVFLASSGLFSGGSIGNLLAKWEQIGVFSYVLPFLIIFALVFAILRQMHLFKENVAVGSILALTVALMSLQFEFVPRFFAEIFPRLGVGLAVILVVLIMIGMFMDPRKSGLMWTLLAVGGIIVVVVLIKSAGALGWSSGDLIQEHWGTILGLIVFLAFIGIIIGTAVGSKKPGSDYQALGFFPFGGGPHPPRP